MNYKALADILGKSSASDALTLGQVIDTLATADPTTVVAEGFGEADSWRGVYAYLAFAPKANALVGDMLAEARKAVGATFEGYKGGQNTMSRETPCHIAGYGYYGGDEQDALTASRLADMLDVNIAERQPSSMPVRPAVIEMHISHFGEWGVFIPDERWDELKAYICKLESIAAQQD